MPFIGKTIGKITGADQAAKGQRKAADAQIASVDRSNDYLRERDAQARADNLPFLNTGYAANNRLLHDLELGGPWQNNAGYGDLMRDYREYQPMTEETFKADPSYKWRLEQGNNALTRSLAAGGNLNSGRALKALTDYNQGAASQEYQAAYGRHLNDYQTGFNAFNTNQNNRYNKLMGLVGIGQGAGQQITSQGLQTGQELAGNSIKAGNAEAAGKIAQGNRAANGFNDLMGIVGAGFGVGGAFGGGAGRASQGASSYGTNARGSFSGMRGPLGTYIGNN